VISDTDTDPLVSRTAAGAFHQPRRSDRRRQQDLHSGSLSTISVLHQHGTCESEMAVLQLAGYPLPHSPGADCGSIQDSKGALFLSDRLPTERVVFESTPFLRAGWPTAPPNQNLQLCRTTLLLLWAPRLSANRRWKQMQSLVQLVQPLGRLGVRRGCATRTRSLGPPPRGRLDGAIGVRESSRKRPGSGRRDRLPARFRPAESTVQMFARRTTPTGRGGGAPS
jgi:hypothetical protein